MSIIDRVRNIFRRSPEPSPPPVRQKGSAILRPGEKSSGKIPTKTVSGSPSSQAKSGSVKDFVNRGGGGGSSNVVLQRRSKGTPITSVEQAERMGVGDMATDSSRRIARQDLPTGGAMTTVAGLTPQTTMVRDRFSPTPPESATTISQIRRMREQDRAQVTFAESPFLFSAPVGVARDTRGRGVPQERVMFFDPITGERRPATGSEIDFFRDSPRELVATETRAPGRVGQLRRDIEFSYERSELSREIISEDLIRRGVRRAGLGSGAQEFAVGLVPTRSGELLMFGGSVVAGAGVGGAVAGATRAGLLIPGTRTALGLRTMGAGVTTATIGAGAVDFIATPEGQRARRAGELTRTGVGFLGGSAIGKRLVGTGTTTVQTTILSQQRLATGEVVTSGLAVQRRRFLPDVQFGVVGVTRAGMPTPTTITGVGGGVVQRMRGGRLVGRPRGFAEFFRGDVQVQPSRLVIDGRRYPDIPLTRVRTVGIGGDGRSPTPGVSGVDIIGDSVVAGIGRRPGVRQELFGINVRDSPRVTDSTSFRNFGRRSSPESLQRLYQQPDIGKAVGSAELQRGVTRAFTPPRTFTPVVPTTPSRYAGTGMYERTSAQVVSLPGQTQMLRQIQMPRQTTTTTPAFRVGTMITSVTGVRGRTRQTQLPRQMVTQLPRQMQVPRIAQSPRTIQRQAIPLFRQSTTRRPRVTFPRPPIRPPIVRLPSLSRFMTGTRRRALPSTAIQRYSPELGAILFRIRGRPRRGRLGFSPADFRGL